MLGYIGSIFRRVVRDVHADKRSYVNYDCQVIQAGLPLLNFSGISGPARKNYFLAVQAAMGRNYEPMKKIFRAVLRRSENAA